jgi:hypothetical protein
MFEHNNKKYKMSNALMVALSIDPAIPTFKHCNSDNAKEV